MKTLVAHDRAEMSERIVELLRDLEIDRFHVEVVSDGVGAHNSLRSTLFDLVILDLTLPYIKDKSVPDYTIVENMLVELFESETLNVPGDLIGITREKEALDRIDNRIGAHLLAVIEENDNGEWVERLKDRITFAKKAARSRLRSINQQYDYDVAVITALDVEFAPFAEELELSNVAHHAGAKEFLFQDQVGKIRRGISFSIGRAGQSSAASATQAILAQFRPSLILMSGYCGGFSANTKQGDVILAQSIFDWDSGKWTGDGDAAVFHPRPDPISIRGSVANDVARILSTTKLSKHDHVLGRVSQLSNGEISNVNIVLGTMASGSAVVSHSDIIGRISALNDKILGVDMEGYGFYFAASSTHVVKPAYLFVKSIADFCDSNKHDRHHEACSYLAATVVLEIIKKRWKF